MTKYSVFAKRHGEKAKFNKKPMSLAEAEKFASQLKKATIPSVNCRSIDIVSVRKYNKK